MKLYYIVSKLNGLVLDLEGGGSSGGQNNPVPRIVPWKKTATDSSQLWYDDFATGTIRNKSNNYCMDVEGDLMVVRPYLKDDPNQQWERNDKHIRNRKYNKKVVDIFEKNMEAGAEVGPFNFNGQENQSWDWEFLEESPFKLLSAADDDDAANSAERRFHIVSLMNFEVVDVSGCNVHKGAKVILYTKNPAIDRNQLWYLDANGRIKSDLNDMVFINSEPGGTLKTGPMSNDPRGHWSIDGKKITNRIGEVLDIKSGLKAKEGAELCSDHYKGSDSQHWRVDYV